MKRSQLFVRLPVQGDLGASDVALGHGVAAIQILQEIDQSISRLHREIDGTDVLGDLGHYPVDLTLDVLGDLLRQLKLGRAIAFSIHCQTCFSVDLNSVDPGHGGDHSPLAESDPQQDGDAGPHEDVVLDGDRTRVYRAVRLGRRRAVAAAATRRAASYGSSMKKTSSSGSVERMATPLSSRFPSLGWLPLRAAAT